MDFETRLQAFLTGAQAILDKYMAEHYPNNTVEKLTLGRGSRYVRIMRVGPGTNSAWAFIDKTNGDVLKPASWKTPAKHARGNIYDESNGLSKVGPYGPAYLR